MVQETLQQAQELLQQKRYDEARALLEPIADHPTAQGWLARLEELAPRPVAAASRPVDDFDDLDDIPHTPPARKPAPTYADDLYDPFDRSRPKPDYVAQQKAVKKRFGALQTISAVYKVFAVIVVILGGFGVLGAFVSASSLYGGGLGVGLLTAIPIIIGTAITAVTLYAVGELIDAFISIEQNTRATATLQKEMLDTLRNSR